MIQKHVVMLFYVVFKFQCFEVLPQSDV